MEPEHLDDFDRLRERVWQALRSGAYLEGDPLRSFQFLVLPSFENPISWDVTYRGGCRPERACLFRSCWRMDLDAAAFSSPVERPFRETVEVNSMTVETAAIEAVLAPFRETPIPLAVTDASVGTDGTIFELAIGDFFYGSRLHWWCELPERWASLAPAVAALELFLKKLDHDQHRA